MLPAGGDECVAHYVDVAPIGDADGDAETNARVAISPIRNRRIDELRVRYDHGNVVVGYDNGAAGADLRHLPGDACDLDPVADGNGAFGQDNETADKVARNILKPETDADPDRAGKNSQRSQMNSGI